MWTAFTRRPTRTKHPLAVCNYCAKMIRNAQPGRNMLQHVLDCAVMPTAKKLELMAPYLDCTDELAPGKRRASDITRVTIDSENTDTTGRRLCQCPCYCGARSSVKSVADVQ